MKSAKLNYSKSKIDKAGEILKTTTSHKKEIIQPLDVLSNWRDVHAMPLDTFAKVLKTRAQKINLPRPHCCPAIKKNAVNFT